MQSKLPNESLIYNLVSRYEDKRGTKKVRLVKSLNEKIVHSFLLIILYLNISGPA